MTSQAPPHNGGRSIATSASAITTVHAHAPAGWIIDAAAAAAMVTHAQLQPPSSVHAKNLQQTYLNALQMMNFNGQHATSANKWCSTNVRMKPWRILLKYPPLLLHQRLKMLLQVRLGCPIPALSHSGSETCTFKGIFCYHNGATEASVSSTSQECPFVRSTRLSLGI